jgi:predicted transcriptional regulator
MPSPVVNFRASSDFVSALARTAQKVGESKSNFIRDAVAARVDAHTVEVAPFDRGATLLLPASAGEINAQRAMANCAYELFLAAEDNDPEAAAISMTGCLTFARSAALHGTSRDSETLVYVLARFGEWQAERGRSDLGQRMDAEALNLAEAMANEGSERMAGIVAGAGVLSLETFDEALRQRQAEQ